jgi:transposase
MIMTEHAQLAEDLFDEVDLLFVSIELALHNWKLACSDGTEQNVHTIDACDFDALEELVNRYINEFELSDDPQVVSCYEAGQDGFWVHRVLVEQLGIQNVVIDPASIEQDQRGKQAKTDPIDARNLVRKLVAYHRGDQEVFSICPVPPEQIEEDRRINRELKRLKKERTAHRNGIRGLLRQQGIEVEQFGSLKEKLDQLETGDGRKLGRQQKREVKRRIDRLDLTNRQIKEVIAEQEQQVNQRSDEPVMIIVNRLRALRGIALDSAWRRLHGGTLKTGVRSAGVSGWIRPLSIRASPKTSRGFQKRAQPG